MLTDKRIQWIKSEGRGNLYSFLSAVFKDEIPLERVDALWESETRSSLETLLYCLPEERKGKIQSSLEQLEKYLSYNVPQEMQEAAQLELRKEFAFLFLTPHGVYPFESLYRGKKKLLMDKPWEEVRAFFRKIGIAKDKAEMHPEDHIAVELGFMATFAFLLSNAVQEEAPVEEREGLLAIQRAFLQDHLNRWVPDFSRDMEQKSRHGFYQAVAALTREFVQADLWMLEEAVFGNS